MNSALAAARALVCESLRLDEADPARLRAAAGVADLDATLALARSRAVLPTLAWTLARHRVVEALPETVRAALGEALAHNAAQNALLLADLAELVRALDLARVPFIALKGAALLALDPRAIACRHTDDIDLLVDEVDLDRARGCALALGYREQGMPPPSVDHAGEPMPALSHHLPPFVSPRGTPLELHFRLGVGERQVGRTPMLPGLRRVELRASGGVLFLDVPSRALLAAHLATHVMLHHGAIAEYLPRHVQDLHLLQSETAACSETSSGELVTPLDVRGRRAAEIVGRLLAWGLAARLHSRRRRAAEALICSTGAFTLVRLARPLLIVFTTSPRYWMHMIVPARAYLSQHVPAAADAGPVQLSALHVRRLTRAVRGS